MTILKILKLFPSITVAIMLLVCLGESALGEVRPVWTRQIGTVGNDNANGVARDQAGNTYVAGSTDGNLYGTLAGTADVVLVKYNKAGEIVWSTQHGTAVPPLVNVVAGVAVSADGSSVYVAGRNDIGGNSNNDVFVMQFDSGTGAFITSVQIGSVNNGNDFATGIAVDAGGSVYVVGYTAGNMSGSGNAGGLDGFLVKVAGDLSVWDTPIQFGSNMNDWATGIAVDPNGDIYLSGYTDGVVGQNVTANAGGRDIFLAKYDGTGTNVWIRQLGTAGNDFAKGVTADANGNVFVAGYTASVLGDNVTANAGGYDIVLVKYDGNGNVIWKRQLGSDRNDLANSVAVDKEGNAYLAGQTLGALDGNASSGLGDLFLLKYNGLGFKQWTRQYGSTGNETATGIAVDNDGNAYFAGWTDGSLSGHVSAGGNDIFLVKYDTSLNMMIQFGSNMGIADDVARGVAVDPAGNTFVAGYTLGGMDGNANAGVQSADMFLIRYDNTGEKQWTRQYGSDVDDQGYGVAVDGQGNVYIAGFTQGVLGDNVITNAGNYDIVLVKYNAAGDKLWAHQLGTNMSEYATGVAVSADGQSVYVAGYTDGVLAGTRSAGSTDIFLVKFNSAGNRQWTRQRGTSSADYAQGVGMDANGNIFIAGYTSGDLGGTGNAGGTDAFLMKYDSTGTWQWTQQRGTAADDSAFGVAASANGKNVYVSGNTQGGLDGNTSSGAQDIFLIKFDGTSTTATGAYLWTKQTGTTRDSFAWAVATDVNGNAYVTGSTFGGLDGYANVDPSGLTQDIVLLKSAGTDTTGTSGFQWTRQLGTSKIDTANGIAADTNGDVYLACNVETSFLGNPFYGGNDFVLLKYNTGNDSTSPVGSLRVNGGALITNSSSASLSMTCTDAGGCIQMQFSNDGANWSLAETYSTSKTWDLYYGGTTGDGIKTVYARFRDLTGNLSSSVSTTIILDKTPPDGSVQINGYPNPAGTNSSLVLLNMTVTEANGIAEVQVSNNGTDWVASTYQNPMPWQLSSGTADNVMRNMYARFKDSAGNLSSTVTGTIYLDNSMPVTSATPTGSSNIGQPIGVTLNCTDGSGCSKTYYTSDGTLPTTASSIYSGQTITLQDNATLKFFSVDNLGNAESVNTRTYGFSQIATRLSILLSTQTIMQSGSIDVSGTLSPYSSATIDLSGLPINIIVSVNSVPTATFTTYTNSINGNYLLQDIGRNSSIFNQKGTYGITAHFGGTGLLGPTSSAAQALLVGNSAGYAVIVEGKVSNEEGLLSHNKTANRIYQHLLDRGFAATNIYYYNYNTSQPGVTDVPSKANVQKAIESLVKDKMNNVSAPLWIIMVDHGGPEKFYIGNESVAPADLNLWLANLEQSLDPTALQEKRIIIIGACYSGSFLPTLSSAPTGSGRIIITSAASSEESYKGAQEPDGIRSGEFFLEELFNELAKGASIGNAFRAASDNTRAFTSQGGASANSVNQYGDTSVQHPLLDDDGDGIGTNSITDTTSDGIIADGQYLGVGLTNSAANPADLVAVTEPQYLDSSTTLATLWAQPDIYSYVDTAWIEVKSPSTSLAAKGGTGQLELNIPKTFMIPNDSTKMWTFPTGTNCGTACFNEPGKYDVYYFTRNLYSEAISQMKRSVVYKNKEGNNAPNAPTLVSVPTASAKTSVYLAWYWGNDPNNSSEPIDPENDPVTYTVEIALNSNFTGTNVVIRREGLTDKWLFVGPDDGLLDQTSYAWRVTAVDPYGAHALSSQNTFTTNNTNIGLPASVSVTVKDSVSKAPIKGATVFFNSTQKTTDAQGKCGIGLPGGQDLSISAQELSNYYSSGTSTVTVADGQGKSQEILLTPLNTTMNNLTVTVSGVGGKVVSSPSGIMCGTACSASYGSTQTVTLKAAVDPGTVFTGWTGDCSGSGTCTVALSSAKNVSASFQPATSSQTTAAADALRALQIDAGLIIPTPSDLAQLDVAPLVSGLPKPDGKINLGDVIVLLRKSVGLVSW